MEATVQAFVFRAVAVAVLAGVLVSCGSGGSDDGPVVEFAPGTVTTTFHYGETPDFEVGVTATHPKDFPLYLYAVVPEMQGVISRSILVRTRDDGGQVRFTAANLLSVGSHEGVFQVHICKDDVCKQELSGSPVSLPYEITVNPNPLNVMDLSLLSEFTNSVNAGMVNDLQYVVGGFGVDWTGSVDASWLMQSTTSGRGYSPIELKVTTVGLEVGIHVAHLTIKSATETKVLTFKATITP